MEIHLTGIRRLNTTRPVYRNDGPPASGVPVPGRHAGQRHGNGSRGVEEPCRISAALKPHAREAVPRTSKESGPSGPEILDSRVQAGETVHSFSVERYRETKCRSLVVRCASSAGPTLKLQTRTGRRQLFGAQTVGIGLPIRAPRDVP